jgi:DNA-binding NarL/FixJ family response regulator
MSVIFLSSDLVFSSRLAAAGKRLGLSVSAISSIDAAAERVETDSIDLVIYDLSAAGSNVAALVASLRQRQPNLAIVAYAPHVHEDRLRAATEAGCNEVLTRGKFDRQMDDILTRYTGKK